MNQTVNFIHHCEFDTLPEAVVAQTLRCLLDLVGVAAGGMTTPAANIMCEHVTQQYLSASQGARILFDGRRVSPSGAALAGGIAIDSLDAHDGHQLTKGHAGVALLPALLAFVDAGRAGAGQVGTGQALTGKSFIGTLAMSYEFACRAGMALHDSVCDYHTSGAWNAIACAAMGARLMGLSETQTREAMGIAEYYGPRSQMMRCIDHPTMVKDGSGWGAMTGVGATYLAASGYTGAPAITVEYDNVQAFWHDLGDRWHMLEQNFKAYPVCRWAQPAVEAALNLQREHGVAHNDIEYIEVFTFHEGMRLAAASPENTEQAQYSLPFPVATALVSGQLAAQEVTGDALSNPDVLRLSQSMQLNDLPAYSEQFPAVRQAHVCFVMHDGSRLVSQPESARGNYDNPIPDQELRRKYRLLTEPVLGEARSSAIETAVDALPGAVSTDALCDLLLNGRT